MPANSEKAPNYALWFSKKQTAEILEVSTKSVELFAQQGKLQTARWKRPSGGPKISVYHPVDVEAMRRERCPNTPSSFVMPAASEPSEVPAKSEKPDQLVELFQAVISQIARLREVAEVAEAGSSKLLGSGKKPRRSRKLEVPIEHRVYLTVREGAAYLGRPERHLRRLITNGILTANTDGHTRVKRAELEQL